MVADRIRQTKTEQINFRLDDTTRADLEKIKEIYGYPNDADAIRGMIKFLRNKEMLISEVEGRIFERIGPYFDTKFKSALHSDEFKEIIRDLMDEVIQEERND